MSDGDVSLIRDEDLLRRMWQQTEDFSRKKEIRAHMYRLREERLRSLYSPEPTVNPAKGCEFSSTQDHVKSFADQSFQSMKSKEVRDAGSPPKEFTYRGQDLKDLSNAGWNVESENITADDGHTHVKSVNANIEGRYDVDGGKGHFSAADHHKQAVTEYADSNTSLKRNEDYSNTSAHEQVVRQTDDGTHFTSTSSSSTSASKFEQVSSKHETVPYLTNDDYDLASQKSYDTNRNEEISTQKISKNSYEKGLRSDFEQGELVSRKVDYPDNNTKVITETRCLPHGTRVTSTRREFHAPSVQTSRSEHLSQQIRNESKATSYTTSEKRFHANESKHKVQDSIDRNIHDIVDSQRSKDDQDFRTNNVTDYSDDISHRRYHQDIKTTEMNERKLHESIKRHEDQNIRQHDVKEIRQYIDTEDNNMRTEKNIEEINHIKECKINENNRSEYFSSSDEVKKNKVQNITIDRDIGEPQNTTDLESNKNINLQDDTKETRKSKNTEERLHNIINESNIKEKHEKKITDQYQTTYQTDYSQRKISKDWSPTHQAWASTLRSDTPSRTTRASSPGSKTYKSNMSSPRSSISPDKISKRMPSRSESPNKIDRNSPTRTISDNNYSSTQSSTYSVYESKSNRFTNDENSSPKKKPPTRHLYSPERKPQDEIRKRPSVSPEKEIKTPSTRPSSSPQRKTRYPSDSDRYSPIRNIPTRTTPSPERKSPNEEQTLPTFDSDECYRESDKITQTISKNIVTQITSNTTTHSQDNVENTTSSLKNINESKESPEKQPGYMRPTASSSPRNDRPLTQAKSSDSNRDSSIKRTPSQSPERKYPVSKQDKVKEENNRFISEENKMYSSIKNVSSDSSVLDRKIPQKEISPDHHIKISHRSIVSPDRKSSSPIRKSPMKDTPDTTHKSFESCISHISFDGKNPEKPNDSSPTDFNQKPEGFKKTSRECSPVKQNLTSPSKKTSTKETPEDKLITSNKQPSRETSPIKRNVSPDKNYSRPIEDISVITTESHENITRYNESRDKRLRNQSPSPNINVDKESSPTRNSVSPSKESPKHKVTELTEKTSSVTSATFVKNIGNIEQVSNDITKKPDMKLDTRTSRRSVSPKKAYKQTLDFIATERTNEEINETIIKESPRNLVTPSTSPTRKPKSEDTAPSTGQSSPTTESGFVYFSSPREKIDLVTDLDEQEPLQTDSSKKVPTDICHKEPPRRTPSPTKIPCRSPSPEKVIVKESLPRKSSLKKPSIDNTHLISSAKPPTSFLISPNDEVKDEPDVSQHNIDKAKPIKIKPPLVRRETYEERCRKILGMTEEDSAVTETKTEISKSKCCVSSDTSPSISPCESPVQHENNDFNQEKYETVDVLDMTDQKYMQDKMTKPKEQIQTLSEIKNNTKITNENINVQSDNYDKNLRRTPSKSPQRKSTTILERSAMTETGKAQGIKKEISQGVETIEFETDDGNINKINTVVTETQHLIKNTETMDNNSQTTESCKVMDASSEFIVSEREQQILDRVQSSLRKLSPDRKAKTTKEVRDNSPEKTSSILPKTNVATVSENTIRQTSDNVDKFTNVSSEDQSTLKKNLSNEKPANKSHIPSKPSSRNVSPIKKPPGSNNLPKNASESGKLRNVSPKKLISHTDNKPGSPTERPQSPQISKTTTGKTKDVISSQYHRMSSTSTIKNERTNITDSKKTLTNKQQTTKISPTKTSTNKPSASSKPMDVENKRASTPKGIQRDLPLSIKKETESKVTRTSSDIGIKSPGKKISPQRMKSKPEIHITASKVSKQAITAKHQRTSVKESTTKLPVSKPKSAIALNTTIDDEYVIIDVQQAKSSRENSPDRICPTPVGFSEDIGTPRFPDEVNEPDDDYNKYKNHVIHETESIVDDIVEISEEDELFIKRSEIDNKKIDTTDECLLSVNDKVTKFTNQVESHKPKGSSRYKDTERQIHSDFVDDNLKSDECLLSVSEKVNKFAKGSVGPKDRSPSRNITEEYDTSTMYTDDYTKLSVNDKAHLFIETAENIKTTKPKSIQKPERPNLTTVDDSLKSDECLLSVSDKVNKFVKTAEQVLSDTYVVDEKDKKIKEQHDKIMKQILNDVEDNITDVKNKSVPSKNYEPISDDEENPCGKDSKDTVSPKQESISNKIKPTTKLSEKPTPIKITTLRSSETVKKAKALFENIASKSITKEVINNKNTKLTDLGISKNLKKSVSDTKESRKPVSNTSAPEKDKQPTKHQTDYDEEQIKEELHQRQRSPDHDQVPITRIISPTSTTRDMSPANRPESPMTREKSPINRKLSPMAREKSPASKLRSPITRDKSPTTKTRSPVVKEDAPITRTKSPVPQVATITTKKVLSRFPVNEQIDSQKQILLENYDKPTDKVPGYQRPTKNSQIREEKHFEEVDVSSRRGSGKFGVELRRTSADRSSVSSERRRSSVEHHQPCIEDIFDIDLLEQMLEKVMGYEQRRRIRAQIRIAKKKFENEQENSKVIKYSKQSTIKVTKTKSPERQSHRSPERLLKSQKPQSPERQPKITPNKTSSPDRQNISTQKVSSFEHHEPKEPLMNGHAKEPNNILKHKETRPQSPEKTVKTTLKTVRSSSPDKKSRPLSPSKTVAPKTKGNRFSEYASAYMKKVGINENNKLKHSEVKTKKVPVVDEAITKRIENNRIVETHRVSKTLSDRTSSKDIIEVVQINGRKPQSPERSFDRSDGSDLTQQSRKQSPERKPSDKTTSDRKVSPERQIDRHTSPKRSPSPVVKKISKKETTTVLDIEKKIPQKLVQEEKPSWVTNRQLKKVTSESRTFSSKKIETEKPKYRASSPSKAITKPIDVITSSYGPGPLDADGKPLFGIKALRNGASNYQVKGTVIRQEFHSRNGGEPEGTVSVTAYSTEPEDLERLLQSQGERPSRLHGLAAITTTKKFGGDTGTTLREVSTKEERAALDQFTHSDRRVTESNIERHTDTFDSREQKYSGGKTEQCERYGEDKHQDSTKRSKTESFKKETKRVDSDSQKETRAVRMQKTERRVEDRKTVRQSSVKSLTEKFIKNASETSKTERTVYPKAGLILRTAGMKDSVSSDSSAHGLARTDSEHSLGSVDDMVTTTTTTEQVGDVVRTTTTTTKTGGRTQERSFLDSSTKVTGVQDILTRMKNADIVIEEGDTNEDSEARALLNKFLGATVLMAGMQSYVTEKPAGRQETVKTHSSSSAGRVSSSRKVEDFDLEQCWDERVLRKLLDECTDYELRRRLRARIRALMAEQEACASAVTEALAAAGETVESVDTEEHQQTGEREEEEVTTVTSSVRRNSSEQTVSSTTVKNTKVIECMTRPAPKPVSPFAKFRQLEKQNSINSPNSPNTPQSPGSPSQPYFKFTDPALQLSAVTIKERLLQWCRDKTRDYENVKLENFSTSWADGLAFCALLHHFLPDAFDYSQLTPDKRRHNFTLAFKIADEKAGIYPLLDVDDMVAMRRPDWKCVFTYVQSIYRRFKDEQ